MTTMRFLRERAAAEQHPCPHCRAQAGETCLNAKTDKPLQFQTAHSDRIALAAQLAAENPA